MLVKRFDHRMIINAYSWPWVMLGLLCAPAYALLCTSPLRRATALASLAHAPMARTSQLQTAGCHTARNEERGQHTLARDTYPPSPLQVAAAHHNIPFFIAAPTTTVDPEIADGSLIPIEQRSPEEVGLGGGGCVYERVWGGMVWGLGWGSAAQP